AVGRHNGVFIQLFEFYQHNITSLYGYLFTGKIIDTILTFVNAFLRFAKAKSRIISKTVAFDMNLC
ncbi:MAG: hypothetical protein IKM24_01105, partial [Clostridia bacterium]|nr:hypothetical protein [Clostridia bacterium]